MWNSLEDYKAWEKDHAPVLSFGSERVIEIIIEIIKDIVSNTIFAGCLDMKGHSGYVPMTQEEKRELLEYQKWHGIPTLWDTLMRLKK